MAAGAQETKKLQELELLMDVQRVIASTDAQRKSLEDMGIDVEKGLTGNGGLMGAISPVLLLSKPHWMKRISAVLTERMNAELQRGEVAMRERERERAAERAELEEEEEEEEEEEGGEDEHEAKQRAQLMLLSVARTAACQIVVRWRGDLAHPGTQAGGVPAPTLPLVPPYRTTAPHGYRFGIAGTVAIGALKHKVREKESNAPRHICVKLWDGWMRTASLRIELEASQWLHSRAMARAVLAQSPASLLLAMRRDAAEATVEAARGGGAQRGSTERRRPRSTNSGRRGQTLAVRPGESIFF